MKNDFCSLNHQYSIYAVYEVVRPSRNRIVCIIPEYLFFGYLKHILQMYNCTDFYVFIHSVIYCVEMI